MRSQVSRISFWEKSWETGKYIKFLLFWHRSLSYSFWTLSSKWERGLSLKSLFSSLSNSFMLLSLLLTILDPTIQTSTLFHIFSKQNSLLKILAWKISKNLSLENFIQKSFSWEFLDFNENLSLFFNTTSRNLVLRDWDFYFFHHYRQLEFLKLFQDNDLEEWRLYIEKMRHKSKPQPLWSSTGYPFSKLKSFSPTKTLNASVFNKSRSLNSVIKSWNLVEW